MPVDVVTEIVITARAPRSPKLVARFTASAMRRANRKDLERLKAILEAERHG